MYTCLTMTLTCLTMTLTACPAANMSDHDSNRLPSGAIGFVTVSGHDSNHAWDLT